MNTVSILKKLAPAAIIVALLAICFQQLKSVKPFEIQKLLPENHPVRIKYNQFNQQYDDENKVFVLFKSKQSLKPEEIGSLFSKINRHFKFYKGITSQSNISNVKYFLYDKKGFQLKPFLKKNEWTKDALQKLQSPFWTKTLISDDHKSVLATLTLSSK
jgi:predicted RND superfamily exporter protein